MTNNNDGTFSIDVSFTTGYTFAFLTSGGTTFKGKVGNSGDTYYVNANTTYNDSLNTWDDSTALSRGYGRNFNFRSSAGTYTVILNPGACRVSISSAKTSGYYLTGTVNNHDIRTRTSNLELTETGVGTNIYTLTTTFSGDASGYQNVTISKYEGTVYHPAVNNSDSGTAGSTTDSSPQNNPKWRVLAKAGKTVTFTLDCTGTDPVLSWTIPQVMIYAKDGATRSDVTGDNNSNDDKYNFGIIADTTISQIAGAAPVGRTATEINSTTSGYETAVADAGQTVKITTTIRDANDDDSVNYRNKYYVKAFNINGVSYGVIDSGSAVNSGVYTYTYTVPANPTRSTLEITPIYYLRDSYKTTNEVTTVTYYLEGFSDELKAEWGDSVYAYPFYGDLYAPNNSFGAYPGQPFLYTDGKYSTEITIDNVPIINTKGSTKVKGVTLNNGYNDEVHKTINNWSAATDECQTYDSDGFYKIYNEVRSGGESPNAIYQRIKLETATNNRNTYGGDSADTWGYTENTPVLSYTSSSSPTATIMISNVSSGNGWELYTDRYGRPIDLFGNVIGNTYSSALEASNAAVRVISSGYIPNIAGDYGSAWLVYYPNGTAATLYGSDYVADDGYALEYSGSKYAIPPSIFMMQSEDSFNTTTYPDSASRTVDGYTYTDSVTNYSAMWSELHGGSHDVLGKYVYITYEQNAKSNYASGNKAKRVDTRWYYSFASDMVNSNIEIQYNDGSGWVDEASYVTGYNSKANQGNHSGCKAYFTNEGFDGEMESGNVLINTIDYSFTAVAGSGYMFTGWYIKDSEGNLTEVTGSSATGTTPNSASDTFVARFMQISDGYLSISNVPNVTGLADTNIQVQVYDTSSMGTLLYDSTMMPDSVTLDSTYISNSHAAYYIKVTASTTPLALNTFDTTAYDTIGGFGHDSFYDSSCDNKNHSSNASVDATSTDTFGFTVGALYNEGGTSQDVKSVTVTSNITACTDTGSYVYKYKDRYGNLQSTSSTIYLTSTEFSSHPNCEGGVTVYSRNSSTDYANITEAMAARAPSSSVINVYQKTLNFGIVNLGSAWNAAVYGTMPTDHSQVAIANNAYYDNTDHSIVVYATETASSYTLTYHYNDGTAHEGSVVAAYGTPCSIAEYASIPTTVSGDAFIGWSTVSGNASKIISPYRNFGMMLTKNLEVYAVYGTASGTWTANVDLVTANREDTNASLDVLCRFTNMSDPNAALPDDAEIGMIIITGEVSLTSYSDYSRYANALLTAASSTNVLARRVCADPLVVATIYKGNKSNVSSYNRYHQILNATYSSVTKTNFVVYSYLKTGGTTYLSSPVVTGTFTGGAD